jgi:hypothetical protein
MALRLIPFTWLTAEVMAVPSYVILFIVAGPPSKFIVTIANLLELAPRECVEKEAELLPVA